MSKERQSARQRRHSRIRKKVSGTMVRPRLSVYKSLQYIYAQLIDDAAGVTLVSASTLEADIRSALTSGRDIAAARAVGELLAKRAAAKEITSAVFDRGGYPYHGRVKALAESAREAGLQF